MGTSPRSSPSPRYLHSSHSRDWRPTFCVPTIYAPGVDPPIVDAACIVALAALSDDEWNGHWRMADDRKAWLLDYIEQFSGSTGFRDGKLTFAELEGFLDDEKNRRLVRSFPSALHGILNKPLLETAMREFDTDNSKSLDIQEWGSFLNALEILRLQYLLRMAFLEFRSFFARGQPWSVRQVDGSRHLDHLKVMKAKLTQASGSFLHLPVDDSVQREREMVEDRELQALTREVQATGSVKHEVPKLQIGCDPDGGHLWGMLPHGWTADIHYYSANNHPLHGIFSCDPKHPLSQWERTMMEIATVGLSLFGASWKHRWVTEGQAPFAALTNEHIFRLSLITLPAVIIWWIFFMLFTCPKYGIIDESCADPTEVRKARSCERVGVWIGHGLLLLGICVIVVRIVHVARSVDESLQLQIIMIGRLEGYAFSWMLMLLVYFNPFIACADWLLGGLIGLGQWRAEKTRFQVRCIAALQKVEASLAEEMANLRDSSANDGDRSCLHWSGLPLSCCSTNTVVASDMQSPRSTPEVKALPALAQPI
eukprot:gnl/TRDRNA2_/TRDRNA2_149040_c0_seq1.p1 gnl/TRDRNA2_/TRDRNA2_149040_c0~~gnl/TRDRNA2_/TRDRNA2_149040_c0_seq1.p1  ORF type:complete len:538 (+),score=60.85 gnl/TRDRNA2_/TRDRNA2_149040_c0_seq1:68-1681(+)